MKKPEDLVVGTHIWNSCMYGRPFVSLFFSDARFIVPHSMLCKRLTNQLVWIMWTVRDFWEF